MTALVLLLSIVTLVVAIGMARQLIRTLGAWQKALEAIHRELRSHPDRNSPTPAPSSMLGHVAGIPATSACPCTCHPLPPSTRRTWA